MCAPDSQFNSDEEREKVNERRSLKLQIPPPPLRAQIRLLLDSLNYSTRNFEHIDKKCAMMVFESLVTVGDKTSSAAVEHAALPVPSPLLVARCYSETCITHLRGPKPNVKAFKEAVHAYLVEDLKDTSPWLDAETLVNCRDGLARVCEWATPARAGEVLNRWHAEKELLQQLAQYASSVIKAMGPSFLELVAIDIARGAYNPMVEEGLLLPKKERDGDARAAAARRDATTSSDEDEDEDEDAPPAAKAAKATTRTTRGGGEDAAAWKKLGKRATANETQEEIAPADNDDDDEPSPAAIRAKKMKISSTRKPGATTVEWDGDSQFTTPGEKGTPTLPSFAVEKKKHATTATGRKKKQYWSDEEVKELERLVKKYGESNWKKIQTEGAGVFDPARTNVHLKDKWRTMQKGNRG